MGPTNTPSSFVFIDQSEDATAKVTGAKRKAIRKQAMRDIGLARREKGGYGKINRRQLPLLMGSVGNLDEVQMHVDLVPGDSNNNQIRKKVERKLKQQYLDAVWRISPAISRQGYERVRMEYGFDLLTLSPLTTVHFSRAVASALSNDPTRLQQLMLQPILSSFLFHVPARYNESLLLQKATKWAIAQAQRVFNPNTTIAEDKALVLLDDVLHELQSAVADEKRRLASDTLCTSQLLAMLTMLETEEARSWTPFAIGAGQILRFRGPDAYTTEFERSMLISYIGFMFLETLSRNRSCFLEDEHWTRALKSMAVTEPANSERHEHIIELWINVFPGSRLFQLTTDYVMFDDVIDPETVLDIVLQCHEVRKKQIDWRKRYGAWARAHNACTGGGFKAREFCAISFVSQLLADRFIVALDPLAPGAKDLEAEVEKMVDMIELMQEESRYSEDWQCDVLMTRKVGFAQATKMTKSAWEKALDGDSDCISEKGTISKELFAEWNRMMNRDYEARTCYQSLAPSLL